jgi:hypothetical protein
VGSPPTSPNPQKEGWCILPNWCSCQLTISGDKNTILALKERAASGSHDYVGPFNKRDDSMDWGSFTPIQMEMLMKDDDLFRDKREHKPVFSFHPFVPVPREVMLAPYDSNRLKEAAAKYPEWFGRFPNLLSGYDWEHKNFGVKWDASDAYISDEGGSDDHYSITYSFDTPWGPPITFMDKLAALYPTLNFSLSYEETGMGFAGDVEWSEGVCTGHDERECENEEDEEEEEYSEEEG